MPDSNSIVFPGWFRWLFGITFSGATLWATFVSVHVIKVPDIAQSSEKTNDRSIENAQNVEVIKSQLADIKAQLTEGNHRSMRIEDKIDKMTR